MKYTKWIGGVLVVAVIIGSVVLLLQTKAKNSYLLISPNTAVESKQQKEKLYTNTQNGFQIAYPAAWTYREADTKDTVAFRPLSQPDDYQHEYITVSILSKPLNLVPLSFDAYVKVAAINEIQNYQKLASIKQFSTQDGDVGYITTWMVAPLTGGNPEESLPIAYIQSPQKEKSIEVFLNNKKYLDVYTKMLSAFKYIGDSGKR